MTEINCTFLIVGGGIAGVSCAESLVILANPNDQIILITESSLVKAAVNLVSLGKVLTRFDVEEKEAKSMDRRIQVLDDRLDEIKSLEKTITTEKGHTIRYKFLCLCTGARPKIIEQAENCPFVIGIRDTESVVEFQKRIKNASKLMIVGNGGIASEIVHEISGIHVDWVIKDDYISSTFVDSGAAKFFQDRLTTKDNVKSIVKRMRYSEDNASSSKKGAALGPDWHRNVDIHGNLTNLTNPVKIHYNCEVSQIENNGSGVKVTLTNGEQIDCDFVVSATGVVPWKNFKCDQNLVLGPDGGLNVDWQMETSIKDIFAAGDVCHAGWEHAKHWFQMRLWTQARQMGSMAARSMAARQNNETIYQDFCFELFNHVTQLFGYQIVLLGRYNGQGLDDKYEVLLRMTPNMEYIKFILVDGKLQGAMLIGETGLEETSENLILNQLDLTPFGDDLLDPNIDIEDYFD